MVKDVCYWLNRKAAESKSFEQKEEDALVQEHPYPQLLFVNSAVEESTLSSRASGLLPQDKFVSNHLKPHDILLVSVGHNDMAFLHVQQAAWVLQEGTTDEKLTQLAVENFSHIYKEDTERYINTVLGDSTCKMVVVCMLYHLDENDEAFSWWEMGFQALGLIGNPENKRRMKVVQHALFEHALKQLQIPNAGKVVPLELSRALDGTNSLMYANRVEPSVLGGEKLADLILDTIKENLQTPENAGNVQSPQLPTYNKDEPEAEREQEDVLLPEQGGPQPPQLLEEPEFPVEMIHDDDEAEPDAETAHPSDEVEHSTSSHDHTASNNSQDGDDGRPPGGRANASGAGSDAGDDDKPKLPGAGNSDNGGTSAKGEGRR
ncbi:unnamed protein product [Amoebophrya sp. A120]|nr:unnamed protein product [Amoebophrya sp. A120]|eukprot:GSA120T00009724001.1